MKAWICISLCCLALLSAAAQEKKPVIGSAETLQIIDSVTQILESYYVFPEVAVAMTKHVKHQWKAGAYQQVTDHNQLAELLTNDLRSISKDLHLYVSYSPEEIPLDNGERRGPAPEEADLFRKMWEKENYGLSKLDILPGNIGYLSFRYLAPPEFAGDTYIAAMNYINRTDALIIDLRESNGALSEFSIPLICSYLFERPVHLNDLYWREGNRTQQSWTFTNTQGPKYLDKPVYVLTSSRTFSGAEELAYDLQNLKRATIIGEVTGGGANPGGLIRAHQHFAVWTPTGRAINPITKTNWEGVGVKPDVELPGIQALQEAHKRAIEHSLKQPHPQPWLHRLRQVKEDLSRQTIVLKKVRFSLPGYRQAKQVMLVGSFNYWNRRSHPMIRTKEGWTLEVDAPEGELTYKYIVDGVYIMDPVNPQTKADGQFMNSLRFVR